MSRLSSCALLALLSLPALALAAPPNACTIVSAEDINAIADRNEVDSGQMARLVEPRITK